MGKHSYKSCEGSEFHLDGDIVNLIRNDDGKLKRLQVMTAHGLQLIKLSKYIHIASLTGLKLGDAVHISGWQTIDREDGSVKLKAFQLSTLTSNPHPKQDSAANGTTDIAVRSNKSPSILLCQKCLKKDGQNLCWALEKALSDRNISDQVTLKKTGCMNQCKTGPHLIVMPDKTHYRHVKPEMVARVVEQHIVPYAKGHIA